MVGALSGSGVAGPPRSRACCGGILVVRRRLSVQALKDACLTKCRNPFTTLFARWKTRISGVFKLGVEQGSGVSGVAGH
jgi:predicted metal-binding membrane protein